MKRSNKMDEKQELDRLRQRVKLLEELIDGHTRHLARNPGIAVSISIQMRKEAGLPPLQREDFR